MKKTFYAISIILIIGCKSSDYDRKLQNSIIGLETTYSIMDFECQKIYLNFEHEIKNFFYGNPRGVEKWYKKAKKTKKLFTGIYIQIDSLIISKEESDVSTLESNIRTFNLLFITLLDINHKEGKPLFDSIRKTLNPDFWPKSLYTTTNKTERQAILFKIKADFKATELLIIKHLHVNIGGSCCFCFHKTTPIVMPESEIVYQGDEYKANIVLGIIDSTKAFEYVVNDKKYIADEYEYRYKEKAGKKTGKVKRKGHFQFPRKYTLDTAFISFEINYEVIE